MKNNNKNKKLCGVYLTYMKLIQLLLGHNKNSITK